LAERDRLDRLIAAEQDERRRIALFLHDGPVQQLAGIALMLDGVAHAIASGQLEEAQRILGTALAHQRQTIRELRNLSFALEPVVLRDQGFAPALRALGDQVGSSHEVRIDLDVEGASALGETTQVALYTIIRELLDQSIRRGPPSRIGIEVARTPSGGVSAVIEDDAEPERRRRSFEAIEERVRQLHGEIEVVARGGGTAVRVTLPPYAAAR
jgi:two-component system, NarL family, sensor kinase